MHLQWKLWNFTVDFILSVLNIIYVLIYYPKQKINAELELGEQLALCPLSELSSIICIQP